MKIVEKPEAHIRRHARAHTHTHTEGDQEEMRITFRPSLSNKCAILGGRDIAKRIAFLLLASLLPHLLKCGEVCACVSGAQAAEKLKSLARGVL